MMPIGFWFGIQLPGGQYISYGYGEHQNLIFADYGDGQVKKYIYGESVLASDGDQGLLTGIIHEDGRDMVHSSMMSMVG